MGKSWDTKKIHDFIETFENAAHNYMEGIDYLQSGYEKYQNNETFVGGGAEATKRFIGTKQSEFNRQQYELSKEMIKRYVDLDETFKTMVDPADDAKIDTDVVARTKTRFQRQLEEYESLAFAIQQKTMEDVDKFRKYCGGIEEVYVRDTLADYDEFCGTGGFLYDCIKKVEEFDDEASNRLFNSGIKDAIQGHIEEISDKAAGLDSIHSHAVDIDKQTVGLVALGASVGAIGAATVLGAKQGAQDIALEKCAANNLSVASANIPFGNRYAQEQMEKFLKKGKEKAKKNYDAEYEYNRSQNTGKTLAELQALNTPDANFPDYTEMVDKWLAEQEKYFDKLDPGDPNPITGATIAGEAVFTAVFYNKVKTGGDMDIKQKKKWEDAFGIPYPEGDNAYFIYHGQVMDAATLGNVTYSYIGAKYYSDFALYSGGAAVQTKRRDPSDIPYMYTLPDYGDMPEDHESIGLGIKWRKEGFPDDN